MVNIVMIKYVFILLLTTCYKFSFTQIKETSLINITQQEGLPSNETYCVFKDSKNYIWIATDQGVVRHKGSTMQVINNLPDNVIFKIREDSKGRVWFFSLTGKLAYFFNEKLYPFIYNDSITKHIKRILINDAYITGEGEIILNSTRVGDNFKITANGTVIKNYSSYSNMPTDTCVLKIDNWPANRLFVQIINPYLFLGINQFKIIAGYNTKPTVYNYSFAELGSNHFGAIKTKYGEVFCWIDNYMLKLKNDGSFTVKKFETRILSVFSDTINNTIMVGLTKAGVAIINTQLDVLEQYTVNNYSVSAIETDNEGEIWLGTLENGVYYTKNGNRQKQFIKTIYAGAAQRMVSVADSIMLFATADGIFKLANNTIYPILKDKNIAVGDLQITDQKNLYYVRVSSLNNKNLYKKIDEAGGYNIISIPFSFEIQKLNSESFWINNHNYVITMQLLQKDNKGLKTISSGVLSIKDFSITATLAKDSNNIILGTKNSLVAYNISANTFKLFKDSSNLFTKGITCMRQMQNSIYAIGIRFGGLALMQDSTVIGNITEADGLLSNSIKYILPLGNRLWLATPSGISVVQFSSYSPLKYTITNFGENVGLNNLIIYQLISFKNNIVAATSKGIYELSNIEALLKKKPLTIPLYITNLNYYKGDTSGIASITLPYLHNRLVVNFDAVCYNTPKELQYYYRLSRSNDTAWNNISSTQIILENLEPGNYDLQIKVEMPKQQRYSAIQTLKITIEKPWWQWNLIRLAAILVLLLLAYILYQWRINTIKKRESEKTVLKTQMLQLEQTALRSQMNPHFIFNCLSSIQQLVIAGNKEEANDYLVKFSHLIRKTLELSANPYITIAQEKEYLLEYLVLEQLRMPEKFDFNFTIANDIDIYKTELPNMMLQPIVENSIRHGIKHLQNRRGKINIAITRINNSLHCEVTDNGIGRKEAGNSITLTSHKSYGMDIVEKRLKGLQAYDAANCFIEIIDISDENYLPLGTKVILQLPFKTNEI
jgi:ligand-binding sensor domain-containing protein